MGRFSFTRAEYTPGGIANLTYGDKYRILVPKKFGGGYILDKYSDFGDVFNYKKSLGSKYVSGDGIIYPAKEFDVNDLYGILAWWNSEEKLSYIGDKKPETMYEILKYGQTCSMNNRLCGIHVSYIDYCEKLDLKYPLKLVSEDNPVSCQLPHLNANAL